VRPAHEWQRRVCQVESDRPDDSGRHQIHVIYAIAADGSDRSLDTDGTLVTSTAAFNHWLFDRTPGRALRLDTYGGQLDITFFRSAKTTAQLAADKRLATTLDAELTTAGFTDAHKKYAVYYDGPGPTGSCGGAAWPPAIPGRSAVMYLGSCPNRFASSPAGAAYWEWVMLHDLFHTFGLVA